MTALVEHTIEPRLSGYAAFCARAKELHTAPYHGTSGKSSAWVKGIGEHAPLPCAREPMAIQYLTSQVCNY